MRFGTWVVWEWGLVQEWYGNEVWYKSCMGMGFGTGVVWEWGLVQEWHGNEVWYTQTPPFLALRILPSRCASWEGGSVDYHSEEGAQPPYLLTCLLEPPCAEIWMSTLASGKSKELSPTYDGEDRHWGWSNSSCHIGYLAVIAIICENNLLRYIHAILAAAIQYWSQYLGLHLSFSLAFAIWVRVCISEITLPWR